MATLRLTFAAAALSLFCMAPALADDQPAPIQLTLKDHQFTPTEIHIPSGQAVFLQVLNGDTTPEEFEMRQLAIEKVVQGGAQAKVRLRPLGPGRYSFIGEYHEETAQGTIIVDAPAKE